MKHLLLLYISSFGFIGTSQIASRLNASLAVEVGHPKNIQWVDTSFLNTFRISSIDSLVPYLLHIPYANIDGTPNLATVATTGDYNDLTNKPTISTGTVTSVGITSSDLSISGSPVTTSGNITADLSTTGVSAGTYNRVTVDTKGRVTAGVNPSTSAATRSFNSAFQISTTKDAVAFYTVQISAAMTLGGGQTGTVFLETSPDNSVWTEVGRVTNGNTGTLVIGVAITNNNIFQVAGYIPSNYFVRLRSTGTATISYIAGQETIF